MPLSQLRRTLLTRVAKEMIRQDGIWGAERHLPLLETPEYHERYARLASFYQTKLARARPEADEVTWHDILMEEISEAFAEKDYGLIIEELIQSAAVILQMIEDLTKNGVKPRE